MIVWVSSYPRSGNTFLRIVLNRLYGVRTSVVYDIDGVAERLGPELIGFEERPTSIEALRESAAPHFVKTHRQRTPQVDEMDKAICLVRDGRDALVSWARQTSERPGRQFTTELRAMLGRQNEDGTGSWGRNVLSWLRPQVAHRIVLRYEDLVARPRMEALRVMGALVPQLRPVDGADIPSFTELQAVDGRFFRRGHTGTYRDEMPDDLHRLFWSRPDNVAAMELLGYGSESGSLPDG